jgi:hypothetical protein
MPLKSTTFGDFYKGNSLSKKIRGGLISLVNCDVHSEVGSVTGSYAFEKISESIVDNLPDSCVTLPNGDTFFGTSSSGKIWKVTTSGVVSLVHTDAQGVIYGLGYFQSYLYYASVTKLGRITIALASSEASWSSQNDSWATFTNTNTHVVKMEEQNESLFIPNKNYIAAVNSAGVFEAASLDIPSNLSSTAVTPQGTGLLIGTWVSNYHNKAMLYYWDTYSPSWTIDDSIPEPGVNMFIDADNTKFIQCGLVGNIYYWSGEKAVFFKRLHDGDTTVSTGINPYGSSNINGLPIISTIRGIFSLGNADPSLPTAQVIEYVQSTGQGSTPGAIQVVGSQIFSGFKLSTAYGIDKLSTTKATAVITTSQVRGKPKSLTVSYDSIPTGCSITARLNIDGTGFEDHTLVRDDENERVYKSNANFYCKSTVQAEISLVPSTTTSPTIDTITII